jgi:hypothetical protein
MCLFFDLPGESANQNQSALAGIYHYTINKFSVIVFGLFSY